MPVDHFGPNSELHDNIAMIDSLLEDLSKRAGQKLRTKEEMRMPLENSETAQLLRERLLALSKETNKPINEVKKDYYQRFFQRFTDYRALKNILGMSENE
jgi:hypothetical protein